MAENVIDSLTVKLKLKYNKSSVEALERVKKTFDGISAKSFGIGAATKKMSAFGGTVSTAFSSSAFRAGIKGVSLLSAAFAGLTLTTSSYIKKQTKVISQQKLMSSYFNVSQSNIQGMASQYRSMGLEVGIAASAMQHLQGVAGNRTIGKINAQDYRVMGAVGASDAMGTYQRQDMDPTKKLNLFSQQIVSRVKELRANKEFDRASALVNQFSSEFQYGQQQELLTKASGLGFAARKDKSIKNLYGNKEKESKYNSAIGAYSYHEGGLRESRTGLMNSMSSGFMGAVGTKSFDKLSESMNRMKPAMVFMGNFFGNTFKDALTAVNGLIDMSVWGFNKFNAALSSLERNYPKTAKVLEGIGSHLGTILTLLGVWVGGRFAKKLVKGVFGKKAPSSPFSAARGGSKAKFSRADKESIKARSDNYKDEMKARDDLRKAKAAKSNAKYQYSKEPESGKFHQGLNNKIKSAQSNLDKVMKRSKMAGSSGGKSSLFKKAIPLVGRGLAGAGIGTAALAGVAIFDFLGLLLAPNSTGDSHAFHNVMGKNNALIPHPKSKTQKDIDAAIKKMHADMPHPKNNQASLGFGASPANNANNHIVINIHAPSGDANSIAESAINAFKDAIKNVSVSHTPRTAH